MPQRKHLLNCIRIGVLLSFFVLYIHVAAARNVTIDDTDRQVNYQPKEDWADNTCVGCTIAADPSRTKEGTYHDIVWDVNLPDFSISINFTGERGHMLTYRAFSSNQSGYNEWPLILPTTGTAITVFFTVIDNPKAFPNLNALTAVDFILDSDPPQYFQYSPQQKESFKYQYPVFSRKNLSPAFHSIVISRPRNVSETIYVNFDYASYSTPDRAVHDTMDPGLTSSPTSSSPTTSESRSSTVAGPHSTPSVSSPVGHEHQPKTRPNIAVICGASIGGIGGILLAVLAGSYFLRAHNRRRGARNAQQASPFNQQSPAALDVEQLTVARLMPTEKRQALIGMYSSPSENRIHLQEALERRLMALEQEIQAISTTLASRTAGSGGASESSELMERMNAMRAQAEFLEQHRRSGWREVEVDDLPPEYHIAR